MGSGGAASFTGPAPAIAGKVLETGESTLDLISGGRRTSIACAPSVTSFFVYPAFAPNGQQIAYVLATTPTGPGQDWGNDIYVADPDGAKSRMVFRHDAPGVTIDFLSWAPDGLGLIFGYNHPLYDRQGHPAGIMNRIDRLNLADGTNTTVLNDASQPALSRDGKSLVYVGVSGNGAQTLSIANLDGTEAHALTINQAGFQSFFAPELSPDSKDLVFAAIGGPRSAPNASMAAPAEAGDESPIGRWLAPDEAEADGTPYQIWLAGLDNGSLHAIAGLREDIPFSLWSADGKSLLILGSGALYTANGDGSNLRKIDNGIPHGEIAWNQH